MIGTMVLYTVTNCRAAVIGDCIDQNIRNERFEAMRKLLIEVIKEGQIVANLTSSQSIPFSLGPGKNYAFVATALEMRSNTATDIESNLSVFRGHLESLEAVANGSQNGQKATFAAFLEALHSRIWKMLVQERAC